MEMRHNDDKAEILEIKRGIRSSLPLIVGFVALALAWKFAVIPVMQTACAAMASPAASPDEVERGIEERVAARCAEIERAQNALTDRVSLADFAADVVRTNGCEVWTAALQKALDRHSVVVIPARDEKYYIDAPVVVPSRRRIEAAGATVALLPGTTTLMLRNAGARDGTAAPLAAGAASPRDRDIAIRGGTWEDCCEGRRGYGASGRFNLLPRRSGNFFGVSTLFYFGCVDGVEISDVRFRRCGAFAVQAGDGDGMRFERIRFDGCFADGLHLNGNLSRVLVSDVKGRVGDDLVALNAYDWLNSSVNFGPQTDFLCRDLELSPGGGYPAIRIQPAVYRYADGSTVDCKVSNVIFRKVRGILTFKAYLQTPPYEIGKEPEWGAVGSGGNLFFEDIDIDLSHPIDGFPAYNNGDPVRGHFAAFEIGSNLTSVHFRRMAVKFHADRFPLSHLVTIGPKSIVHEASPERHLEIFDPYVSCRVGEVTIRDCSFTGTVPEELVHVTVFDDINRDGRSSGRGLLDKPVAVD